MFSHPCKVGNTSLTNGMKRKRSKYSMKHWEICVLLPEENNNKSPVIFQFRVGNGGGGDIDGIFIFFQLNMMILETLKGYSGFSGGSTASVKIN